MTEKGLWRDLPALGKGQAQTSRKGSERALMMSGKVEISPVLMTRELESAIPQMCPITRGMCMRQTRVGGGRQGGGRSPLRALTYTKPACSVVTGGSGGAFS